MKNFSGFSVIIPTLQKSPLLHQLITQCAKHPLVNEIILINNLSQAPLAYDNPKIRVFNQKENIFVNPAWNLGYEKARSHYLLFINDDVEFEDSLINFTAQVLLHPFTGMCGIDGSHLNPAVKSQKMVSRIASYEHITLGYGMFFAMPKNHYVKIPDSIKIWGGDDWLFMQQKMPNKVIFGANIYSPISATSSSPEFQALRLEELHRTELLMQEVNNTKYWHRPVRALARLRKTKHRLKGMRTRHG